jgi:hypothetical protein
MQRRISTKETNNKKALKIAEEFEQAAKTKRTLKQVQKVLDRLQEEISVFNSEDSKAIECLLSSSNEPSAPVHPKEFDLGERQRKTGNLSNQFADLIAATGLRQKKNHKIAGKGPGKRRNVEPLSFYSLRRIAMTLLHEAGIPSAVAQALIRHDSEAVHGLYIGRPRGAGAKKSSPFVP